MGKIVIVAYKPLAGKQKALDRLMETHANILQSEGLVTARHPVIMRAADGTVIEVFEWKSQQAIEAAHSNAAVNEMWQKYAEVCEYIPIASVPESSNLFSEFTAVN